VHDAKRFEVDQIFDVAFNSNGIGILFKILWAAPFNVPSEDTWEPMRGVDHLNIFPKFLRTDVYREFSATPDFVRFRNRWPARTPDTKTVSTAQRGRWCLIKEGRVSYPSPFISLLVIDVIYFLQIVPVS
jgi:hypothetical protein